MFSIYNAPFIAYILLSCFEVVTDRERDVVRFILDLVASYNITTGQLPMTPNVDLLAQIYHVELRVLATLHSSHSEGSVDENLEAADLLSAVVLPIVQNATREEYAALLQSMGEAESLLTGPLETLNELAVTCKSRNHEPAISWPKSEPRAERPRLSQAISCKSSSSRSTPRSECSKELELLASSGSKMSKSRARSKTFHFSLPHFALGGRIIALDSGRTMDYERSKTASWYSTVDATFEKELQDIVENAPEMHCLCHTGHICFIHAEGHPSDYETKSNSPSRRKFTRNLRLGLKRILTSQSV